MNVSAGCGGKIGPEFTFGITMDDAFEEPVLIIKTAWGGKSLFYDYRPRRVLDPTNKPKRIWNEIATHRRKRWSLLST